MASQVAVGDKRGSASPLGHALLVIGDMWVVRILREVHRGKGRFQQLRRRLEISDPVLSRRLRSLVADGLLETRPYQVRPPRNEYVLTEPGRDLWQVLVAMWLWDGRHASTPNEHVRLRHRGCDRETRPIFTCGACGALALTIRDVQGSVDDRLLEDVGDRRSRRSTAVCGPIDSAGVLGDRWSTLILSDAFLGSRRFSDFQQRLHISPVTLTDRLALFTDAGILARESVVVGGRRREYALTPKGSDFFVVTTMINAWAQCWLADGGPTGLSLVHRACGQELAPRFTCNLCRRQIGAGELEVCGAVREQERPAVHLDAGSGQAPSGSRAVPLSTAQP